MKTICLLLIAALSMPIAAQNAASLKKIDSLLTYYESKNEFMGSVALSENGKIIFEKAYGFRDIATKAKADKNTKYKIGSITKMFTAAVIFQLIEDGKLTLDTKLATYYPQIPNAELITVANLLEHRSGIFNYTDDEKFAEMNRKTYTRSNLIDLIKSYQPHFTPNTKSEYSNSNYMLLGFIIEDLTKKSYGQNVADRIIKPLKLTSTFYGNVTNPAKNEAYSYRDLGNKWIIEDPWDMSLAGSAGAMVSTASDLTRFIEGLFVGKIIKPESLAQMTKITDGYGRGIFPVPFGSKKGFGHTGGIEAFVSMLGYLPEQKVALAICSNGKGRNNNDIAIGILSYHFNVPFMFPNLEKLHVDESILTKHEGTYSSPGFPLKINIRRDGSTLIGQATGQSSFPLDAISEKEFMFRPAGLTLIFTENKMVLKQGGGEFELSKE
ncbi:MAG TPA: serine hydrolase domain-containing protein [Flavobacterium sp.]|jgi:CubicO group peptidase (beta-lactamase class C family)